MKFASIALTLCLAAAPALGVLAATPAVFAATAVSKLGDLSSFHTIVVDTQALAKKGDLAGAQKRITDFETAWDTATASLYARDKDQWTVIDLAADKAITSLRAKPPVAATVKTAVAGLLAAVDNPAAPAK